MKALQIYAGPKAMAAMARNGVQASDVRTIAAAAGGPKGLILGALDRFIFGDWLSQSTQSVDLVGASIGAWRMAAGCLNQPRQGFDRLEQDYTHQHFELQPGQKRPTAAMVSDSVGHSLRTFYEGRVAEVLNHPRYRLHIITSRGRHVLRREHRVGTPVGYFGAFVTNALHRKAMGAWLERVVFSNGPLPFATNDYRTRLVDLTETNFNQALQASCSIPFVLQAVHDIPGAPPGAYWDGGITDYHLHLNYLNEATSAINSGAAHAHDTGVNGQNGLVLYPHFQKAVVPGWLDKHLKWRHHATPYLDSMLLLAPNPEWVKTLPNGKLPDRTDFTTYGNDLAARVAAWTTATRASEQMAEEFAAWLERPDMGQVQAI